MQFEKRRLCLSAALAIPLGMMLVSAGFGQGAVPTESSDPPAPPTRKATQPTPKKGTTAKKRDRNSDHLDQIYQKEKTD